MIASRAFRERTRERTKTDKLRLGTTLGHTDREKNKSRFGKVFIYTISDFTTRNQPRTQGYMRGAPTIVPGD